MEEVGIPGGEIPVVRPPAPFGDPHSSSVVHESPHDALHPAPHSQEAHVEPPRKKRGVFLYIFIPLLLVLGFVGISAITYGAQVLALYRNFSQIRTELDAFKTAASRQDLASARVHATTIDRAVLDTKITLRSVQFLKNIPSIGTQFVASDHLLSAVDQTLRAGIQLLQIGEGVQSAIPLATVKDFKSLSTQDREKLLALIHNAAPKIDGINADLALAQTELQKMPTTGVVRQIKRYENELQIYIPQIQNALTTAKAVATVAPDLAGYPKEKRYLVLFLNNTELRPGGGFIGSFGILRVKDAEIVDFKVRDVWDLDNSYKGKTTPPDPINKYLVQNLKLRDSNWSPDFPTSAQVAVDFYLKESRDTAPIDGVLGLTPDVIHGLLELTGPIQVPGYPYTFTPENFNTTLENAVEYDFVKLGLTVDTRKQILGDLNKTLLNKVLTLPREKWPKMVDVLGENVTERHLMVYLTKNFADRDALNTVLTQYNWDGHMLKTPNDFFMLVDANFYGLKTDPVIDRKIQYTVHWKNANEATATATITYKHTGFLSRFIDAYQTYSRVFVPEGAKLLSSKGTDHPVDVVNEEGKTSFGYWQRIEPQTTEVIVLEYALPKKIVDMLRTNAYRLDIQKQLGGFTPQFSFTFQGPKEIGTIQSGDATVTKVSNRQVTFSLPLTSEAHFQLTF